MNRAIILDRDGVLNDNAANPHVNSPADLHLFSFASRAVRILNNHGFLVCVATNQGGVGLGFMDEAALDTIHDKLIHTLRDDGARIDDIVACTHAPRSGCSCRKPKPGMLFQLRERNDLDLAACYMVGDRETDVQAGQAAGTRTVFIGSGRSSANHVAANLLEAVHWILADVAPSTYVGMEDDGA